MPECPAQTCHTHAGLLHNDVTPHNDALLALAVRIGRGEIGGVVSAVPDPFRSDSLRLLHVLLALRRRVPDLRVRGEEARNGFTLRRFAVGS